MRGMAFKERIQLIVDEAHPGFNHAKLQFHIAADARQYRSYADKRHPKVSCDEENADEGEADPRGTVHRLPGAGSGHDFVCSSAAKPSRRPGYPRRRFRVPGACLLPDRAKSRKLSHQASTHQ